MCTGHMAACLSFLKILSDMQQIFPEQGAITWQRSAHAGVVICHDFGTGNANT